MPSRPRPDLVAAGRAWSTAAILFHQAVADRFGLSVTDLKALDVLQRRGALTAGELAAETGLASASVTSLVDRLEKKRLVRRALDPRDRRKVRVELGAGMRERVAPLFEPLGRRMRARARRYDARDAAVIERFLLEGTGDMRAALARLTSPSPRTP